MAKNKSILKIEGSLDGMTFYKTATGHFVRTKGGISKDKIMRDPAFARTRENMQEFAHVTKSSSFLRRSIGGNLLKAKDNRVSNRLNSILTKIKKLDTQSARGERLVGNGITDPQGKLLLKGFDFNRHAPLWQVLLKDFVLDTQTGVVSITQFAPAIDLNYPEGSTHVQFGLTAVQLDFTTQTSEHTQVSGNILTLDQQTIDVHLSLANLPNGNGVLLYLLLIEFFQSVNGTYYPLRNGAYNVLHIIEVV